MPCAFHERRPYPFQDLDPGCQFHVGEDELTEIDGKSWCDFHLPIQTKAGNETEKAKWDEQRISDFNMCIFEWVTQAETEEKTCDLTGVVFPGYISFKKEEPYHAMHFLKAQFAGPVDFVKARFADNTNFVRAQFADNADFGEAQFFGAALFREAQFSDNVNFGKVQFSSSAYFNRVKFSGPAWFDSDGDLSTPEKIQNNVFHEVDFSDSTFRDTISFNNRQFRGRTDFGGCTFEKKAPEFHSCTLHQNTNFDGATFPKTFADNKEWEEKSWVKRTYEKDLKLKAFLRVLGQEEWEKKWKAELQKRWGEREWGSAERAYRTLKLAMEQVRARKEEARFYALEQNCRRARTDTDWSVRLVSTLYLYTSDYGKSFKRPLAWLAGVTSTSWLFYTLLGGSPNEEIFDFTLTQLVRPFNVWLESSQGNLNDMFKQTKFVVKLIATCQSLFSLSLLVLFFLALRQNFKRG
ncbi:MAG: hypothetical protein GKS05_12465 [Nitrospirales bacterium]|nr:hypothetical protein [Nitrospirales bacterium]